MAQRHLRLELAGAASGDDAAREIHKRISSLARARTFVDWRRTTALVTDLEAQHRAIMEHVAGHDPKQALGLLWRFLGLAESIFAAATTGAGASSPSSGGPFPTSQRLPHPRAPSPRRWQRACSTC